ncbi:trans-sulfuration enzyme family protein [Agriterribacter sp.]|uniref:trans-sulfuration enzyme family protein n=1 Tax=Agriterribacter sp. TaxID=2821509 RepID=UPI002C5FC081|nr:aminotransferase class I/II-fold pyridoxal phosphate-dependent enzyme [Agriterribacter sp.]HTN05352.1 aminotransferase class I/II-fold pyridoxal phosphate-dependent enzyme [Agriterribacter sp.]
MKQHPITQAVRIQTSRTKEMEHSTPLFLTSSFCFEDAEEMRAAFAGENDNNIYSRFSNPTVQEFIDKMCALEGTEAGFATSSGMSAIFGCFMAFLNSGDHLLSCKSIFGSTHTIVTKYLHRWKIDYSYADINKPETWESLIRPNTKLIYVETPTNPGLDIVDMEWLGKLAKKHGIILIVDNCFATPILQKPAEYGADLVLHSATKWLDGQGRVLGGVVVGREDLIRELYLFCRNTGPSLSPFNAWILSKSLETLDVRIHRHCDNAEALVKALDNHPKLNWIKYPFHPSHPMYAIAKKQMTRGGGLVTFDLKGGVEGGKKFMDALEMLSLTSNLGDTRSIASHPASTTHSKLSAEEQESVGITPGLIRVSVGLEHAADIIADIEQALEKS